MAVAVDVDARPEGVTSRVVGVARTEHHHPLLGMPGAVGPAAEKDIDGPLVRETKIGARSTGGELVATVVV